MMETKIKILAVVLGLQLVIAAGFSLSGGRMSAPAESGPLVNVDLEPVNRIILEGPDGERVVLAKVGEDWELPENGSFPADEGKISRLLDRLAGIELAQPVAASSEARQRFKVSEQSFERKIVLSKEDEAITTLFLGTSPGVRRIHVRKGTEDAIHAVELAAHEFPVDVEDWQNKRVLQFDQEAIATIRLPDLQIRRQPADPEGGETDSSGAWLSEDLHEGESLNAQAVDKLAKLLADLRIGEVLGRESSSEYGLDQPLLALTVDRREGEPIQYMLGKSPDGEEYTLKTSTRPEYFRLPSFRAQPLVEAAKRDNLIRAAEQTPADQEQEEITEEAT